MMKIEELTENQNRLMDMVATEYENIVLSCDDSYSIDDIVDGIDFIYRIVGLKQPQIVICSSPLDMTAQAGLGNGQTIDYIGQGYDAGWTAYFDFMERIGVTYEREWGFEHWKNFIRNSGVFATVLCENVAFVCVRPCEIHRTDTGDLHNEKGPAIAWADGYAEFFLNGVAVDESLVMTPAEKIDPVRLIREKNAEVRREIVRKIGLERIVMKLNAEVIDKRDDYELMLLDLKDGRKREFLKMKNPSIDIFHVEGVPPGTKTVDQALAWRNGVKTLPEILT